MQYRSKIFLIVCIVLYAVGKITAQPQPVGHWNFDNANNLTAAVIGNDLVLTGSHTSVSGPKDGDGAVRIGPGSYYIVPHGISPNGGGTKVNVFTLLFDIKIPMLNQWYCFYQTDGSNQNDGEMFINPQGRIGVAATGYTEPVIEPEEWYRLAIVVRNGHRYDYYMDGVKILSGNSGDIDGRFSFDTSFLLFADNDGEDNNIDVADVKLFDTDLSDEEIDSLGGFDHQPSFTEPDSIIYPYLQSPTAASIYISWHASNSEESIVRYGLTKNLDMQASGSSQQFDDYTIWHTVKLENLQPDQDYYYQCQSDTLISDIFRFRTPPAEGQKQGHLRFAILGDNRTNPSMYREVIEAMKTKCLELYSDSLEHAINLVFNVGDIVTDGLILSQYKREYFEPIRNVSANVPFMVSIGNHENEANHYYNYMKYEDFGGSQGERYYSFRMGRVQFIALNSNRQVRNQTQITWLEQILQSAQNDTTIDWIFTFLHHPGHSEIWPDGNTEYVQNRIIPVLANYPKVDMLSYGHSHNYERGVLPESALYLMLNGGGGSNLDRWGGYDNQRDYPEIHKSFDHYCYSIVDINIAQKSFTVQTYSLGHTDRRRDNELIDSFFRNKSNETPPNPPERVSPAEDERVELPVLLTTKEYIGQYDQMSVQFQITSAQGDYKECEIDTMINKENIYWDSGPPDYEPINLNQGLDLKQFTVPKGGLPAGKYWWRTRYRDSNLQWSDWSEEASFRVKKKTGMGYLPKTNYNNKLYTNYPNPFNPYTVIKFEIKNASLVTLDIFSVDGKQVRTLINDNLKSGVHSVIWDGKDKNGVKVPSGTYFYQINAGGFKSVKRALFLK